LQGFRERRAVISEKFQVQILVVDDLEKNISIVERRWGTPSTPTSWRMMS
jgi:hypothetical protein